MKYMSFVLHMQMYFMNNSTVFIILSKKVGPLYLGALQVRVSWNHGVCRDPRVAALHLPGPVGPGEYSPGFCVSQVSG